MITNGLFIALELVDAPGVTVVMPGGTCALPPRRLVGDIGACVLDRYHVQKGIFGARGFTLQEGLTDVNQYEVELKRLMVSCAKEVIAVVDSSKWGQVAFATFASLDQIDHIISDSAAPAEMISVLQDRGVKVTIV